MIYSVDFHIPGTVKVGAESPEEAERMVEAMDAYELHPFLESTVVDKVRNVTHDLENSKSEIKTKPPESIQRPSGESPEARTKTSGESPSLVQKPTKKHKALNF